MKRLFFLATMMLSIFCTLQASEFYATLDDGGKLTIYYDEAKESRTGTILTEDEWHIQIENAYFPNEHAENITSCVIDPSVANYKPTDLSYFFLGFAKMVSIEGLEYFDTSKVIDMKYMFAGCTALTSLDLSNFDTSKVLNMSDMFRNCSALTSLDLSNFNTSGVKDMNNMFYRCEALTSIGLSNFDTPNVKDMSDMFCGCSALTSLDLSNFNISSATQLYGMFNYCSSLKKIYVDESKWNIDSIGDGTDKQVQMFYGCESLVGGNGTSHREGNFEDSSRLACVDKQGQHGYLTDRNIVLLYALLDDNGKLTICYDNKKEYQTGTILSEREWSGRWEDVGYIPSDYYGQITSCVIDSTVTKYKTEDLSLFFAGLSEMESVEGLEYLDTSNVTDMSWMFSGCSSQTSLNLKNFGTSNVTNMKGMFSYCSALTKLDLSDLDTSKATDMSNMFVDCSSLKSLNLSNFDTSNVTDMHSMFIFCQSLTNLDLSNFDTSNVTDMKEMFGNCFSLKSLELSNFDTSNVTDMSWMFSDCTSLMFLDLSNFDTSNVTNMKGMFSSCSALTSLDLSSFNTSKVTDMEKLLYDNPTLTNLDLSSFDTSNVTNMEEMFCYCSALTSLDLSSFNTSKVTNMTRLFYNCKALTTIYADDENWNTAIVKNGDNMFNGCKKLVGGNGTKHTDKQTDKVYACIDKAGQPGYLTDMRESGISNVEHQKLATHRYYTIGGKFLQGKPTKKGVYVTDGKKVMVE